jgi:hypothetical protein
VYSRLFFILDPLHYSPNSYGLLVCLLKSAGIILGCKSI